MSRAKKAEALGVRRVVTVEELAEGVRSGDRTLLARAITLIESRHPDHQADAQLLLSRLAPLAGRAQRVGISGVPGVGKSTLIDALGMYLIGQGHRVAVLAVDPSSSRTGGSILGDKTRMARLAAESKAFIRPSPAAGKLGGVARTTRETMMLCEAAGFDVVIVETVGAGQSETMVADMVDFFLVLVLPGAGDELQGIKKGILELADMIAVTKADGDNAVRARLAKAEYVTALHILAPASPYWSPPVLTVSALANEGLDLLWQEIMRHRAIAEEKGLFAERRKAQQIRWMWSLLEDALMDHLRKAPRVKALLPRLEAAVAKGEVMPAHAVEQILKVFEMPR